MAVLGCVYDYNRDRRRGGVEISESFKDGQWKKDRKGGRNWGQGHNCKQLT